MSKARDQFEIAKDRQDIARLYLQGKTQCEIATVLFLHQSTVSRDLKAIQEDWRREAIRNIDERKAQELARIDLLEREYWEAWKESKQEKQTSVIETSNADSTVMKEQLKREWQVGNPAFLAGIEWCIEQRLKIFGFYAPTKIAVEDLDALIEKEMDILNGKTDGQPANELIN